MKRKILLLLILIISLSNYLKAQNWEGYGSGINYARIQNDTIIYGEGRIHEKGVDYQTGELICKNLVPGINVCEIFDDETSEFKYNLNVDISQDYDTISIYHSKAEIEHLFVKDKLTKDSIDLIEQIEIELYGESYQLRRRTTIDFSGVIKIENFVKDSIIKIEITQDEIDAIRSSIRHLNYTQLNNIYGTRNFTGHESEIGFRFITKDNSKYQYISVEIPEIFQPLLLAVREIKKVK